MRVGPDGSPRPFNPTSSAPSLAPPQVLPSVPAPQSRPGQAPVPMSQDCIAEHRPNAAVGSNGAFALGDWMKKEWSTVAGAAHGLASAPGVVSKSWSNAAETNESLAKSIRDTVDHWQQETASGRQVAIEALDKTARPVSKAATTLAHELAQSNRLPLAVENLVNVVIDGMPKGAQHAFERFASFARPAIDKLPAHVEASARGTVRNLEAAAAAQAAKASGQLPTLSRLIGKTIGEMHAGPTGNERVSQVLDSIPVLREVPAAGLILTGAGLAYDVRGGKSVADATLANGGATIVGTAAGSAVSRGLSTLLGAAIADEAAGALGAAVATGPAGWAVAGGVVAAAAVGYGVYKTVESQPGQDIVDGVTQLDTSKIERGFNEGRTAVLEIGQNLVHTVSTIRNAVQG